MSRGPAEKADDDEREETPDQEPDFGAELDDLGEDDDPLDDAASETEPANLDHLLEEADAMAGAEDADDLDVGMSVADLGAATGDDTEGDAKDFLDDDLSSPFAPGEKDSGEEGFESETTEVEGDLPPLDGGDEGVVEDSEVTSDDEADVFDEVELAWDDRSWTRIKGPAPSSDAPKIVPNGTLPGLVLSSARQGDRKVHVVRGRGLYLEAEGATPRRIPGTAGVTAVAWVRDETLAVARLRPSDDGSFVFLLRTDGSAGLIVAEVGDEDEPGVTSLFWDGETLWASGDFGTVGLVPQR